MEDQSAPALSSPGTAQCSWGRRSAVVPLASTSATPPLVPRTSDAGVTRVGSRKSSEPSHDESGWFFATSRGDRDNVCRKRFGLKNSLEHDRLAGTAVSARGEPRAGCCRISRFSNPRGSRGSMLTENGASGCLLVTVIRRSSDHAPGPARGCDANHWPDRAYARDRPRRSRWRNAPRWDGWRESSRRSRSVWAPVEGRALGRCRPNLSHPDAWLGQEALDRRSAGLLPAAAPGGLGESAPRYCDAVGCVTSQMD